MSKQFWIVLLVIAAILGGILVVNHNKTNPSSSNTKPTSHIVGDGSKSDVTLVEYGDYQCTACQSFYPAVKQVTSQYSGQIFFQFREFPLTSIHPNAFASARAAEAAGLQNKYFEMHDLLYENHDAWAEVNDPLPAFQSYAKQLGLNLAKFNQDFASTKVNDLINADMAAGNGLGIDSTPTFYLDGSKLDGSKLVDASGKPSAAAFARIIDAEIAKKAHTTSANN